MRNQPDILTHYRQYTLQKIIFVLCAFLLLILLAVYSVAVGSINIPLSEVTSILFGGETGMARSIIWNIRLPRVFTAIIIGAGLAAAGAAMQTILRNPLGSPFTLGISQAAAFGAAFAIIILGAGTMQSTSADAVILNSPYLTTITAFAAAMAATFIILLLAKYKGAKPETMILTGVAIGSLCSAGIMALQYIADEVQIAATVFWQFGDVGRTTWRELGLVTAAVIPSILYFIYNSWNYKTLNSGEETAQSLGVDVERLRLYGMILASFLTALAVSFVGIIGFVGLVVPHITRKILGGNEVYLLPGSCMVGAILLLASDTLARTIISPIVVPVGILTSFLGAPLFIYLVIRGREYW